MTLRAGLVVACLAAAPAGAEDRFALVVGANAGWPEDRVLQHAESDARKLADVLVELGHYPREQVVVLTNPDTAQVRAGLAHLMDRARAAPGKSLVFFFYSGHADAEKLHLRGAPLGLDELYQVLKNGPATVRLGVFDACRSGSIVAAKGGAPVAPFEVTVVDELSVRGLALLTSSGADELSQEQRALQGSVFTHHFISGLRGAADVDQDGLVTLAEAYRHAQQRTAADTAATVLPQRPAFRFDLRGSGELVMTWPAAASARLRLPRTDSQRFVVVDERELSVVAEARSTLDHQVAIALPAGRYRVKQVFDDRVDVAELTVADAAQVEVAGLHFVAAPAGAPVVAKGSVQPPAPPVDPGQGRTDGPEGSEIGHGGVAGHGHRFSLGLDFGAEVASVAPLGGRRGAPLYLGATASFWLSDWFLLDLHGSWAAATSRVNALVGPRFRTGWWPVSLSLGLRAGAIVDTQGQGLRFAVSPILAADLLLADRRLLLGLQVAFDVPVGAPALTTATRLGLAVGVRF